MRGVGAADVTMFSCGRRFVKQSVGTPVLSNASPLLTAPHLVFTDRGGTAGKTTSSTVFAPARAIAFARLAGHARRFQTRSRFARRTTMENFFKRKDPPNGASGISASANKSAKTSSAAGGSKPPSPKWTAMHGSFLARVDPACAPNANVAAFDLDDTLQKTRSGRPGYVVSELDDFVFWSERVADAVRSVHARGHAVVIFSNQGGVKGALDGKRAEIVRRRVDALAQDLGVPVHFFCGTQKGSEKDPFGYRKPQTGAWRHFETKCNGGVAIDLETSYYVGDAAGRPGDHSDSDAAFARNVGVRFFTPEAFFAERGFENVLGRKAPPNEPEPAPRKEDEAVVALDETDTHEFDRENTP